MGSKPGSAIDQNIALIGFMGSGKSAVAQALSAMLCRRAVEMDAAIEEREGMSIADIFRTRGEAYFRGLETKMLEELEGEESVIVSCGGGTAMREKNVRKMKERGTVVLLRAAPGTILERVKDSEDRPLLEGRKNVRYIGELMEQRRERYEAAADIVIDTDEKTVRQVCEELIRKLEGMKKVLA